MDNANAIKKALYQHEKYNHKSLANAVLRMSFESPFCAQRRMFSELFEKTAEGQ